MNVLFLSPGPDTCGLGIATKRAFDAYDGEWHARHVRLWDSPWHYPADVQWDRDDAAQNAYVADLWRAADVLVLMERPEAATWGPRRPTVVWHLGTWFRRQIPTVHEQCRAIGATEVADMPDLLVRAGYPMSWMPDVLDPTPLQEIRKRRHTGQRLRIVTAPTDRAIKRTDIIEATVSRLRDCGYEFDYESIEGVGNAECIERKSQADIFVDDMGGLGIGLNALECWAMGVPVVSHVADPAVRERMREDYGGELPFIEADPDSLEATLAGLLDSANLRRVWGATGHAALWRFHCPEAAVRRWTALFERMAVPA